MSDRYRQAKTIAMDALEQPAANRTAWLATRCAGDDALRREAEWLLAAADTDSGDHLAGHGPPSGIALPPLDAGTRINAAEPEQYRILRLLGEASISTLPLDAGARIDAAQPGQYRILRLLGEGGMGMVYLAERDDGGSRQSVALKLLGGGVTRRDLLTARMAEERRILALLNHPNIAHLLDGGFTADGQPFIAMEYVEGKRIDTWCEARALPLHARLRLFRKVCAAVEHAHQRLVIHRDLKPANILVSADGEPKLLDFGIARLVEDAEGSDPTRTAHRALTPAYASPEHVEGKPLTTATDVWSLGIVLYELLTGLRPHQAVAEHQLPGAILSGDIRPPSARPRTGTPATNRPADATASVVGRIPADIDAIVLKALRTDPAQRYPSVAALSDDIRRFLESRPVLARRGHALYRLRRFAVRHRWRTAAAAVALLALGGYLLDRNRQLQDLTAERNKAQALSGFMTDLFANADPSQSRGEQVTVREVLDRGAIDLRKRTDLPGGVRADLLLAMGNAYDGLQLTQAALPMLEESLQLKRAAGASPLEASAVLGRIANLHANAGENDKAIAAAREGQALLSPDNPAQFSAWAGLHAQELRNMDLKGDMAPIALIAALQDFLASLSASNDPELALVRIDALQALANTQHRTGNLDAALRTQEQAVAQVEKQRGEHPAEVLTARTNLGTMLLEKDLKAGLAMLEAVDRDYVRLIGDVTGPRAILLNQIGVGYSRTNDQEAALRYQTKATQVARQAVGTGNRLYLQLAVAEAGTLTRLSRNAEAEVLLREVLPRLAERSAPGVDAVNHAYALAALAQTLLKSGNAGDALGFARKAEEVVLPHASGGFMIVYDNAMRALVQALRETGDTASAHAAVARYRTLLDERKEPADSRWRKTIEHLQASIQA